MQITPVDAAVCFVNIFRFFYTRLPFCGSESTSRYVDPRVILYNLSRNNNENTNKFSKRTAEMTQRTPHRLRTNFLHSRCMSLFQGRSLTCVFVPFRLWLNPVASPGFVARRGKAGKVMEHSRQTSGPRAAAVPWLIVMWLMQYWSKELRVVDICTNWFRILHNIWIVGSDLLQSKLK